MRVNRFGYFSLGMFPEISVDKCVLLTVKVWCYGGDVLTCQEVIRESGGGRLCVLSQDLEEEE